MPQTPINAWAAAAVQAMLARIRCRAADEFARMAAELRK